MTKQLDGKVCIVTGGAGSLGLASARLMLEQGARVMLVDLRESDLQRVVAGLGSKDVDYAVADVSKAEQVKAYVDKTVAKWGKIDVLFSNAGNFGQVTPIADYPEDVFDSVLAVNVKGAFLAGKYGLPNMNDGGSIIITSSVVGIKGGSPGTYGYMTAKQAQIGLMRCLAKEAARRNIRVNTIHPGPIDNDFQLTVEKRLTEITGKDATQHLNQLVPLGRHVSAEEMARSVLYLASDLSIYTNGTTLVVDGGMLA
jgi:NAD(P)-dependent dehydrogenase (short-subunit alcohol dehydrogenase family)